MIKYIFKIGFVKIIFIIDKMWNYCNITGHEL